MADALILPAFRFEVKLLRSPDIIAGSQRLPGAGDGFSPAQGRTLLGSGAFQEREVAAAITDGPIAPPTMLSVWFRPHHWTPGASGERKAMQLHFDLKEQLGLPEAVVVQHESVFGEPVRPGDVLTTCQIVQSIGEPKQTKVGRGRFWTIDVRATNQRG